MKILKRPQLLVIALLLASCQIDEHKQTATLVNREASVRPLQPKAERIETQQPLNQEQVVVDSLQKSLILHPSPRKWAMLDSLACLADGEGSENMQIACVAIWSVQLQAFNAYLVQHPKSCLRQSLIWGMSEDLVVLRGDERVAALALLKKETRQRASKAGLTQAEQQHCNMVLADVRPEIFD